MSSNPLQEYPVVRQWAYRFVWFTGLVLGGIQVWYGTTQSLQPTWLLPALAVLAYVSVATNYTADMNVSSYEPKHDDEVTPNEAGADLQDGT